MQSNFDYTLKYKMNEIFTVCHRLFNKSNFLLPMFQRTLHKKGTLVKSKMITSKINDGEILNNGSKLEYSRPFRVSVEGNIGAGKTTIINYLGKNNTVEIYPEPIDWWRNLDGHNLLNLLYTDIDKWYVVFQKYVQLTRLQVQTSKPKNSTTTAQIFERSLQCTKHCFIEQAKAAGHLNPPDFDVLEEWFNWINDNIDIEIDLFIYLRTDPETAWNRIQNRGRKEEATVPFDYIKQLHESHEKWLVGCESNVSSDRLLIIDGNGSLKSVLQQCDENKQRIITGTSISRKVTKFMIK